MTTPRLSVEQVRGVFAIMPTPAVEGAEDPSVTDTVDHEETARAVRALIDDGVDAVLTTGTFGECATLTWDELRGFAGTAVDAAEGRAPVFVGATTLNTRDTIARARVLRDLGVTGLLLGRPMWCHLDDTDIVRYYTAVAAAVPELAIIVYDNPEAFKGKISSAAYRRLAALPQVVAAKYPTLGPTFTDDLAAMAGRMRALPVDRDWFTAWEKAPGELTACWSGSASCGPRPHVELARRIAAGDAEGARRLTDEFQAAAQGFLPQGQFALFAQYNIQLEKIRIDEAGYVKAGPSRPPYLNCPEEYAAGARASGRRFAELQSAYGTKAGSAR
ncbi:dihydrodipicolinate synthase family protein [Streptomyces sp. NPDC088747]|uniref:dihydrodipicolinate synthase family protein n=1 Tax=Streptomyces sp. NPDC088747 TaxID=3365886 RepID=UPI00381B7CFF